MPHPRFAIRRTETPDDLAAIASLFRAYAASIDVDLAYQGFEAELAGLPGKYAPPEGALLLARETAGNPIGCVAFRPLPEAGACEMKRLYAAPPARGSGLGRALVDAAVAEARQAGYTSMCLDTLPSMAQAITLYRRFGFADTAAYYHTPVAGTLFLRLMLADKDVNR